MAKRKKTPDVLATQKPQAREPKRQDARKQRPSTDQSAPDAPKQVEEESANPYAVLFPPQPVEKSPAVSAKVK